MGELWSLVPAAGWQRWAWDVAWQSTLLGLLAIPLLRGCRRWPALRANVALSLAVLCIAAPLASLAARSEGWGLLSHAVPANNVGRLVVPTVHAPLVHAPVKAETSNIVTPKPRPVPISFRDTAFAVFAVVWLSLSGILLVRLARSALAVRRACGNAIECDDVQISDALGDAARAMGVSPPELLISSTVDVPALVTWGRSRLLLPAGLATRGDWFAIFCHELAHLARRDGWSRLAMETVTILIPCQPLVWRLRREWRAACEEACDDWAVARGTDPVEFASLLLDFVPQAQAAVALGMSESVATARDRIVRLLAMQTVPRPQLGRALGIAGWILAALLGVTLALLQYGQPPWLSGKRLPPWGNVPMSAATANFPNPPERPRMLPYLIEPPDILLIDAVKVVPKPPYHIEPLDTLELMVIGTMPEQNIHGPYPVEADGTIVLGPAYGTVKVNGMTLGEARSAITEHLEGVLTGPQVSVSLSESAGQQQIEGEHLVGPDGTVNLGTYGSVYVAGMTISDVRNVLENRLEKYLDKPKVSVDVYAYNSKFYYIVWERNGTDHIMRVPITGQETLLDALTHFTELQLVATDWVWVARPNADGSENTILPVDWQALFRGESTKTNYFLLPGDRVFVQEQ